MIAIIDYNMGNLASVKNAFDKLKIQSCIVKDTNNLQMYDKVLLPGVGAFKDAMEHLEQSGMIEPIKKFVASKKPLLGICLGMQLLFESSKEFGETRGLGLIEGHVKKFDKSKFDKKLKIPHMGWNVIKTKNNPLFETLNNPYLYFVHSFHVECDSKYAIGTTNYGYDFVSAVQKDNIYGFQPHPEKSHDEGLQILKNFAVL